MPDLVTGFLETPDGKLHSTSRHPDDFPAGLVFPVFAEVPRLWSPESNDPKPIVRWVHKVVLPPKDPSVFRGIATEVSINVNSDAVLYQRMLAKIALGSAILKHGPQYFKPIVNEFILGNESDGFGKYVFSLNFDSEAKINNTEVSVAVMVR